ncbi:MAG: OmpA family protein [Syntrophales bacterium]|nr:OmpA family protein [Syntrophales bacterium]
MSNGKNITIIKRKKKRGHEAHGGSWKVAYADFVTAMMAFFLLLWLLSMVSPEKRMAISDYFQNYNLFKEQTAGGGKTILPEKTGVLPGQAPGTKGTVTPSPTPSEHKKRITAGEMAERMKESINRKLRYLKDQVLVDTVEGGVRIQITDLEGSPMFALGSDVPTEKAIRILELVAENIRDVENKIAIEGHTDAAPFTSGRITNWELSTSRASAARRVLEKNGIEPGRIARVVGYADQELLIKENPLDPRNRRISIILLNVNQSAEGALPAGNLPPGQPVASEKITPGPIPQRPN